MAANKCIKSHFVRGDIYSMALASRKYSQQIVALYAKYYGARMRYLLYFLMFLLCACSSSGDEKVEKSNIRLFGTNAIKFVGSTSKEHADLFEKILSQNHENIDTLIIDSSGGDISGGMQVGRLVHEYSLKVIVKNICASSCANYIATASHSVTIEKDALLGWHGGATQPLYSPVEFNHSLFFQIKSFFGIVDEGQSISEFFEKLQNEEIEFFETIGVNQAVTVIGMMPSLKEQRDAPLFSFDIETLRRLGLRVKFEGEQSQFSKDGSREVQIFTLSKEKLDSLLKFHNKAIMKGT